MASPLAHRLDGSRRVRLADFDPAGTQGIEKDEGLARLEKLGRELSELENLLTYAGTHALLVVLQGRDASGKDGTIRKILEFSNIQQSYVHPFKVPTEEERAHDFLWRAHQTVPPRGPRTPFNPYHLAHIPAAARPRHPVQPISLRRRPGGARPQDRTGADLEGAFRPHQRLRASDREGLRRDRAEVLPAHQRRRAVRAAARPREGSAHRLEAESG